MPQSPSRPEEIARSLRDAILSGVYRPGERLPSERDLATRMDANRSSVREALVKLSQERLIEIRRGGGARVASLDQASLDVLVHLLDLADPPDPVLVAQWLDVHEIILTGAVRLGAERASEEQIREARRLLARLGEREISDEALLRTTGELAELISAASQNLVLRMVRNALKALFERGLPERRAGLRPPREALPEIAERIDRALCERDAQGAEEGVRRLVRAGRERVLKGLEAQSARTSDPVQRRST